MRSNETDGVASHTYNPSEMLKNQCLPKLTSKRLVQSIGVQTNSTVKICTNSEVQTDNISDAFLASVNVVQGSLPLINCVFGNDQEILLLDTGSSISLLDKQFFESIKDNVTYKHLASSITITTLNSKISFSACVKISFKIDNCLFRHPFYIVDFSSQSQYKGILGNDFIISNKIIIDSANNTAAFGSKQLDFINKLPVKLCDNINVIKETSPENLNHDTMCYKQSPVYLMQKVQLDAKTDSFFKVHAKVDDINQTLIFNKSKNLSNIDIPDQLLNLNCDSVLPNNVYEFYVYINNGTHKPIHVNKGTLVGNLNLIEHIKDSEIIPPNFENCNLIAASENTLLQRKLDLLPEDFSLNHLNYQQKEILLKILLDNSAAFSKSTSTLGHTDKIIPEINFLNNFPHKVLPFPVPQALQKEMKDQIDQLCEANIIERHVSPWSCPLLMVKKKCDPNQTPKYRLALDLRMLNSIIQGSSYPLPKIQTIISNLTSFTYFTSLDLQHAYHQIDLPTHLQDKLTFTSIFGSFKYKRLVFGLKTAASTFQALMDSILDEINIPGVYAYQDDLIFGSNSFEETQEKLTKILNIFKKYNLTLSPSKCSFHKTSTDYLGFHIENNAITPITSNISKINAFPVPKTKRQLKRFIGLATFYKHLIPSFSKIMQPLIDLTSTKRTFSWTENHQNAFNSIQNIFFKKPMVSLPNWDKTFYLSTDGSATSISGCLQQMCDNQLIPIAYFSKSLKPSEKNYPALKIELMAIHRSVTAFKYYLFNRDFIILSDSKPLKKYKRITNPADCATRWLMELSQYSFVFQHIPGNTNVLADYLSRENFEQVQETLSTNPELINEHTVPLPIIENSVSTSDCTSPNFSKNSNSVNCVNQLVTTTDPPFEISNQTFQKEQLNDPDLAVIIDSIIQKGSYEPDNNYFIHPDSKILMLKKSNSQNSEFTYLIVVPKNLKSKTLSIAHMSHFGLQKTYEFLCKKYFWKGIYSDTLNYVSSCTKCLKSKHHRTKQAPFQSTYTPKRPNNTVSIDLLGPFVTGQSILTVIDHFSRHLEMYPLRSITASKVVHCLLHYITTFGRPTVILSDLGKQFTAQVFNLLNSSIGIKVLHSSVAHPQSNSISERINTSIKYTINMLMEDGFNFEQSLLIHKALYNGSKHGSTNFSPNLLHFGRELSLIFDTYDFSTTQPYLDNVEMCKFFQGLNDLYNKAYHNIHEAQKYNYNHQLPRSKLRNLNVKDIVYLKSVDKFKPRYDGPFEIVHKHSPVSFTIKRYQSPTSREFKVHIDRILKAPPRYNHLTNSSNPAVFPGTNVPNLHCAPYNLRTRH